MAPAPTPRVVASLYTFILLLFQGILSTVELSRVSALSTLSEKKLAESDLPLDIPVMLNINTIIDVRKSNDYPVLFVSNFNYDDFYQSLSGEPDTGLKDRNKSGSKK